MRRVTERTAALVDRITDEGLLAALEFHPGTLTETAASANELLDALGRPGLRTHWQPDPALSPASALDELAHVTSHLAHLHVFAWGPGGNRRSAPARRRASRSGLRRSPSRIATAPPSPVGGYALCEYVRDDDPEQFVDDVRMLRRWLDALEIP